MLMNYWNHLNARERGLVGLAAGCLIVYLLYLLIYSPLITAIETKSQQVREKQETLVWMQQIQQQPRDQKKLETITNTKLLALMSNQLGSNPFRQFAYQLQQTGTGDIQLTYNHVPFNQFLSWFWTLTNHYAVVIKQFSAERSDTPGVVKLMLVLTAK